MTEHPPVVAIIGAGFGGLRVARALRDTAVKIVLIDRHNYHLFQPLLYQVATAGLSPMDIAYPVRAIFHNQPNVEFRLAEATGADLAAKTLRLSTGDLPYDYLVLAVGGMTHYFGLDSVAKHAFGLKDVDDAVAIRNHLLKIFELAAQESDTEKRRAMLTFVVAGGGPTGVESAGALSELVRMVLAKDYARLHFNEARVVLLEATDRLLANFPESLRKATTETLRHKHVEVRFGAAVSDYDGHRILLKNGDALPTHTLIWAAGIRAASLTCGLGLRQGRQGRIVVTPTLQAPDHPELFVIGDAACLDAGGEPLPMVAPVAMQQAETAAGNIRRMINGQPCVTFIYKDSGSLATIGRHQAVAQLGKLRFSGFVAWVLWLTVHLLQLIGFRNKLMVMINWTWEYWSYDRAIRLITKE
ncbi:MAG: NAD(P)/FAD-dependent oxidoreductase [Verrucomicrobia bacterium]|nr:NAD(P)/FAD-dependent oxidoreductase [Verrucomicrobiota bacterium]